MADMHDNVIDLPTRPQSPTLSLIARWIWHLNYADLLTMARDLHSDSDIVGKSPHDVAELLSRWASRQLDESRK